MARKQKPRTTAAAVLDRISDAVVALDADWRITFLNAGAAALLDPLGRTRAALIGKRLWDEFPALDGTPLARQMGRAVAEQTPVEFEEFSPMLDRWFAGSAHPSPQGLVVRLTDVTERRRADEEREQLLAGERAARAESEAANRSKDEFLAVLSHELRTPLTAMLGWTRMLKLGQLGPPDIKRALEAIDRNTTAQAQLIDDLLDVSRIITGKLHVDLQPVDVLPVMEAAIDSMTQAATRRKIVLEALLSPVGPVLGDEVRLRQVVANLLANAVKFTPEGGRVQLRLERQDDDAVITVTDTGVGIAPDDLPNVFIRFRQGRGSQRTAGGLGLGLAIAQHLVIEHGGRISVHSEGPGRGAEFTVRLPLAGSSTVVMPSPSPAAADIDLGGVMVLVVEDDSDIREIVRTMLETQGAKVTVAESAEEGLRAIEIVPPDVLVSDIGLEGLSGYALIRRVRAMDGALAHIPAIALTAYARDEDRGSALAAGYQMHLTKPIEPSELRAAVASLAGRRAPAPPQL